MTGESLNKMPDNNRIRFTMGDREFFGENFTKDQVDRLIEYFFEKNPDRDNWSSMQIEIQERNMQGELRDAAESPAEKLEPVATPKEDSALAARKEGLAEEVKSSRPRSVQLIGLNHRSSIPLGEVMGDRLRAAASKAMGLPEGEINEENAGIRKQTFGDEDVLTYQTAYVCVNPACNPGKKRRGRRYSQMTSAYTTCHQCKTRMKLEPATSKGLGATKEYRDADGNYMVATKLYVAE